MVDEDAMRDKTSLDELRDGGGYMFKNDTKRFLGALPSGGNVIANVTQTRRPFVKAMVMHVISCITLGCPAGLSIPCQPEFCKKDDQGRLNWTAVDAAALKAVRAAGRSTVPSDRRWSAADMQSVVDYMQDHTFACERRPLSEQRDV